MIIRILNCIAILILTVLELFSQKVEYNNSVQDFITKSTPQAYQFQKYGDLPVNYNTGVAEIKIPMFKIDIKNVSWNVGIGYHAGGIKVNEVSGCVGLGWNLNAAGMISARTFQRADVLQPNEGENTSLRRLFNLSSTISGSTQCQYANPTDAGIAFNIYEARQNGAPQNYVPDIFYLNAGALNAKFFLKNNHNGYCLPSKDIIIQHYPGSSYNTPGENSDPGYWIVTDEKGTKYTFEWGGGNATTSESNNNTPDGSGGTSPLAFNDYNPIFVLTKIENTSGEKITFTYTKEYHFYKGNNSDVYHYNYPTQSPQICNNPIEGFQPLQHKSHYNYVIESRLDMITASTGESIVFEYSQRQDLPGLSKLDKITEYFKTISDNSFVKSFVFTNGYFGTSNDPRELRLKLTTIKETGIGNNQLGSQYSFEYNPTSLPSRISTAQDYFGYYNGQDNNTNLVPVYGGNRTISFAHTKACVLEKVTYPTGGYTTLEYELKDYGGLRIKRKTDYTLGQGYNYKEYQYGGTYFAPGTNLAFPKYSKDVNNYYTFCAGSFPAQINCHSQETYSEPVMSLYDTYYGLDNTERYSTIVEYSGSNGTNGATTYNYGAGLSIHGVLGTEDLLTGKSIVRKNANVLEQVSAESYTYVLLSNENWGSFFADPVNSREARAWGIDFDWERLEESISCGGGPKFDGCFPSIIWQQSVCFISTPVMLSSQVSTVWDATSGASVQTTKNFTYDINKNLLPKTTTTWDSKGNKVIEKITYPTDYHGITDNSNPSAGIKNLYTLHDIVEPIEKMTYRENSDGSNNRLVGATFTTYKATAPAIDIIYAVETNTGITNFVPSYVNGGSVTFAGYSEKVSFNAYNSSNDPLEIQKKNDIRTSYVWLERQTDYTGGRYRIPAASVINASQNEIAYTSFETGSFDMIGGSGNWSYYGTPVYDATAPTGSKVYSLTGSIVSKSSLNATGTYVVSYWTKNAHKTVSNTSTVLTGKTVGGWTYYEHKVVSPANGTVIVSGDGTIDELRLYPSGALMTSYTFKPLIGMESQTDPNNNKSTYEYDAFNRLTVIRDQDNNILKKICYNYAGQPENCTNAGCSNTIPDWQNTSTPLRCQTDTSGCYTGYQEQEQRDMNPCSNTINNLRWVLAGFNPATCTNNTSPNWQNTITPPRCQLNGYNCNTGYQEQEQMDMNACSNSHGSIRWVLAGYNSGACNPGIIITYNSSMAGFVATYSSLSTGQTYTFNIPSGSGTLGCIPAGTYSLNISKSNFNRTIFFDIGCRSTSGTYAWFRGISVSAGSCDFIHLGFAD